MAAGVVLTGPLWPALTCAARFRAVNLLAYLALPGGLALTCTALYCIYLSLTWFLLEETLNVLLLCLTLSPFHFFNTKFCLKKHSNLIINITQIVYLIIKSSDWRIT